MTVDSPDRKEEIRKYLQHVAFQIDQADFEAFVDHVDELMEQNGWDVEMAFRVAAGNSVPAAPPLNETDRRLHRRVVVKMTSSKLGNNNDSVVDQVFRRAKELGGNALAIAQAIGEAEAQWGANVAAAEEIDPISAAAARASRNAGDDKTILRFVFRDAEHGDAETEHQFEIKPGDTDAALQAIVDQAIKQAGVDLPEGGRRLLEEMLMGRARRRSVTQTGDSGEVTLTPKHQPLRERLATEAFAAGVTVAMTAAKAKRAIHNALFDPNPHDMLVIIDYALRFSSVAYLLIYYGERRQPGAYWNLIAAVGMSLAARQARRMARQANFDYGKEVRS